MTYRHINPLISRMTIYLTRAPSQMRDTVQTASILRLYFQHFCRNFQSSYAHLTTVSLILAGLNNGTGSSQELHDSEWVSEIDMLLNDLGIDIGGFSFSVIVL